MSTNNCNGSPLKLFITGGKEILLSGETPGDPFTMPAYFSKNRSTFYPYHYDDSLPASREVKHAAYADDLGDLHPSFWSFLDHHSKASQS